MAVVTAVSAVAAAVLSGHLAALALVDNSALLFRPVLNLRAGNLTAKQDLKDL